MRQLVSCVGLSVCGVEIYPDLLCCRGAAYSLGEVRTHPLCKTAHAGMARVGALRKTAHVHGESRGGCDREQMRLSATAGRV